MGYREREREEREDGEREMEGREMEGRKSGREEGVTEGEPVIEEREREGEG